jgi:hypothetical protein
MRIPPLRFYMWGVLTVPQKDYIVTSKIDLLVVHMEVLKYVDVSMHV